MKSYFFFAFHIFKDFYVTFMCQIYAKSILNLITKLSLKYYFSKSDQVLKSFLIEIYFQCYLFKIIFYDYFCLISGR